MYGNVDKVHFDFLLPEHDNVKYYFYFFIPLK